MLTMLKQTSKEDKLTMLRMYTAILILVLALVMQLSAGSKNASPERAPRPTAITR